MATEDRLGIDVSRDGGNVVITLRGELDLASAPAFSSQFDGVCDDTSAVIVIDLSELEFMDSTGLRSILLAHERCNQQGRRFAVVPGGRQVARLLEIARVEDHLEVISAPQDVNG